MRTLNEKLGYRPEPSRSTVVMRGPADIRLQSWRPLRTGARPSPGIEIKPVYAPADVPELEVELPGEFPFTRGPYPTMYRGRPWTIRQYAGFGSAEETNERFRYLLELGPDRPLGRVRPADAARLRLRRSGRARRGGPNRRGDRFASRTCACSSRHPARPRVHVDDDQRAGGAPPPALRARAEEQGVRGDALRGTVQNDILKEYIARGNYIFPPRPSMRITTDIFAYCAERLPQLNTISISGYHIREAGSTAVQELAFTVANGIAYADAAVECRPVADQFGERVSFFFNAHNDFLQEVAKFRAARRLWARVMRDRFGVTNPKALALRFHAQTGGSTLTAQQPENNIVRVAIQALAAVCGGAQSLHTNSFDEALALPTEHAARIALRTQQVFSARSGNDSDRRSARRLVRRRGAHARARGGGLAADRACRGARRCRRSGRARLRARGDRPGGVPLCARRREG